MALLSRIANALKSATTIVNISSATAPTTGQVLTATSGTAATWQTAAGGGAWALVSYSTAAATTSITISSLDLAAHNGIYKVYVIADGTTVKQYTMTYNAVASSYVYGGERYSFGGASWTNGLANSASAASIQIAGFNADVKSLVATIDIIRTAKFDGTNAKPVFQINANGTGTTGSNDGFEQFVGSAFNTGNNPTLTSLTFTSSTGSCDWKVWVMKAAIA